MMCVVNCNNVELEKIRKDLKISGDLIEIVFLVLVKKYKEYIKREEKVVEIFFDFNKWYMGVIVKYGDSSILFVKGVYESLIGRCKFYMY